VSGERPALRRLSAEDRPLLVDVLTREWGAPQIVSRGRVHDASLGPAIGAFDAGELVGLATYDIAEGDCQILTLNAFVGDRGIGTRLVESVAQAARSAGCQRLWLITTNDNAEAIRFYERRGLRLVAVHHGAMDDARRLKPSIPEFGAGGVRISDELEFELELAG
jgi:ribosomal protein S18 acetylase RimI-like enzyme